jgi:hypothetical protein
VNKIEAVPLLTWGYAMVFVAALAFGIMSLIMSLTPPPSEAFFLHNAERLERLAEGTRAGATGVVMLGDSRMRYGTYDDQRLGDELTDQLGRQVEVARLVNNWGVFDDFTPLIPLIFAAKPRLVILEEALLTKEFAPSQLRVGREYLNWRIFGAGPWNPGNLDQAEIQQEMRCNRLIIGDVEMQKTRANGWISFDPLGDNARRAAKFVEDAIARGLRVEFLAIPVTTIGQAELPTYQRDADLDPLVIPTRIPDQFFCDLVHMNPQGRDIYATWFTATVGGLLQDSGS